MEFTIKILTLFLLSALTLLASEYPSFSNSELLNIEKRYGKISKARINDYIKNINDFKYYPKNKQLLKVNLYLNQLLPQYDDITNSQEDHWATPKEFLSLGYGDCEDYAIIKYFTLIKLGFDKNELFLTTVYERYQGGYHMVLSYFDGKNKEPWILDNLSFRVLPLNKRTDLKADMLINESGVYKLSKNGNLIKIGSYSIKFKDVLNKVEKEKL
jgi:predicted transglutaminase-like cysteine proteinase